MVSQILNSFGHLEELSIFRLNLKDGFHQGMDLSLNLPLLTSVHLNDLSAIKKLTLNSPKLQRVKFIIDIRINYPFLDLVHGESVEWLIASHTSCIEVKKLKNLKYFYIYFFSAINSTFLSYLKQLKEIHLHTSRTAFEVFKQKQRYDRVDLKIYLVGCLLNSSGDPSINLFFTDYDFGKSSVI